MPRALLSFFLNNETAAWRTEQPTDFTSWDARVTNMKSNNRRTFIRAALSGAAALSMGGTLTAARTAPLANPNSIFRYKNPIYGVSVRDCQIVREGGIYYMTGTFPPFWSDARSPGVRITQSTDLLHWSKPKVVIPPDTRWYQQLFWAPEIFPFNEKFYVTFNCPANGAAPLVEGKPFPQAVGLAVADSIMGPYTVLTNDQPLCDGNDATLFLDTDGRVYLYSTSSEFEDKDFEGIICREVDLATGSAAGAAVRCISKGEPADWDGGKKVGIEGPSVFKRGSIYYLMYSSWRRGYEVGYAIASNPRGPWTKYLGSPIFGAQDPDWCKQYGGDYDQAPDVPFGQVGHGSPFFGPDGRVWFCCHGIEQKGKGRDTEPHLVITPVDFRPDDSVAMELTWTPQTVPIPARVRDPLWRDSGTPASETPHS